MGSFEIIKVKLERFIRRYYLNRLVRGTILFVATGLLYLILTLFIEHQFWLNTEWRTVLFWCFVLVEFTLFLGLMAIPLAQLFNLRKGISFEDASEIIGKHFPEVDDRLTNVLQLSRSKAQSELLIASINQKSKALQPIPFKTAVNFKSNVKYIKYAAIPILIILLTFVSGNSNWFNSSYERVVNYQTAYEPPAPFQFFVVNEQLEAIENQTFLLEVRAEGSIIPETVQLQYGEEVYFLQPKGLGKFQFVFSQLDQA